MYLAMDSLVGSSSAARTFVRDAEDWDGVEEKCRDAGRDVDFGMEEDVEVRVEVEVENVGK